ncbi:hypothetical protein DXG03_002903 [Asterophora parasitica]|uniref:MFS general substrate transporter n=1 Tax=Asterophora parasitica TaxID=117018 RepID=A0A9P7G9W8_9AGAR|nr:hypothetical protein DXG03_002903 [Asterophora parasitica]
MAAYSGRFSTDHEQRPLLSHRTPAQDVHDTQGPTSLESDHEFGGKDARAKLERSLLRKIDRRMSILVLIYILNYIDRNNAAAARLRGFEEDLHLEGNQFASILSILYVGYIFMQIPSWLFFIEGSLTVVVAIGAVFVLPDFPENSSWLTPEERALALHRMAEDAQIGVLSTPTVEISSAKYEDQRLQLTFADWKVWWLAAAIGIMTISLSFNAFFPTLSATMGYNETITLLLCFLIASTTMDTIVRYVSLFLMAQAYAGYVCFLAWSSGTLSRPSSKRAVALAFINCGSTVGNIAGSYAWPPWWGPTYAYSYSICIGAALVAIGMCILFRQWLKILNLEAERTGSGHKYPL